MPTSKDGWPASAPAPTRCSPPGAGRLARTAYGRVEDLSDGDARAAAVVRAAGSDVYLKQYRSGVDRLRPLAAEGPHQAEARLYLALAARGQGQMDAYERAVRELAEQFPTSPYTEEGTQRPGDLVGGRRRRRRRRPPSSARWCGCSRPGGSPSGRPGRPGGGPTASARWPTPCSSSRSAPPSFPRSDYRPSWLYWSARAKEQLGDASGAAARYTLAATDYQNSYYGRLALRRMGKPSVPPSILENPALRPTPPPTQAQIALLLSLGLNDLALAETQFARRTWGDSPALVATTALAQHRAGRLRLGINAMKRAYPQYLAAGGESLPPEVMRVLYPLDYWPVLEGGAAKHGLDKYLVAALAAQESTFDAQIRSSAGAVGLMQIMPATGRGFARRMGIKPFSTGRLTDPSVNAAIGTQYLADLVAQFGGAPYALAAYNAGEHRVVRWRAERPGLPEDEWIDDIPFPETQNYVKRILGTAEDYRRLYGGGVLAPLPTSGSAVTPMATTPAAAPVKAKPAAKAPPAKKKRRT